jgi:hypothetical protein
MKQEYTPVIQKTAFTRAIVDPVTGKKTGQVEHLYYYGVRDPSGREVKMVYVRVSKKRAEEQAAKMCLEYTHAPQVRQSNPQQKSA